MGRENPKSDGKMPGDLEPIAPLKPGTNSQTADYAQRVFSTAQWVDQKCRAIERELVIAGRAISLRFSSAALEEHLTRAFAHPASTALPNPGLKVYVFDLETTNATLPTPPWKAEWRLGRATSYHRPMLQFEDERFLGLYEPRSGLLSVLDTQENQAVWCVAKRDQIPAYELSAPFRPILHWWMREQGLQVVHAGAVGNNELAVLLVGRAGSGKSTTALAVLESGLYYLGDDYILVEDHPVPEAWSLYRTGKLNSADVGTLPCLVGAVSHLVTAEAGKTILFLNRTLLPQHAHGLPIGAILVPAQTSATATRFTRISAPTCLCAMAPSTMLQLRGADRRDFESMGRLVRRAPSYRLELGSDRRGVQRAVSDLLARI